MLFCPFDIAKIRRLFSPSNFFIAFPLQLLRQGLPTATKPRNVSDGCREKVLFHRKKALSWLSLNIIRLSLN